MPKAASRKHEWKDEYTLLCERCGYILEDLDQSLPCPECGMAITESIPGLLTGTPWQRNPSILSLIKTWWSTVFHPLSSISLLREHTPKKLAFLFATSLLASSVLILGIFGYTMISAIGLMNLSPTIIFLITTKFAFDILTVASILIVFTLLEQHALIFLRQHRGTSGSKEITKSIITHACTGWIVSSILIVLAFHVGNAIVNINTENVSFSSSDFDTFEAMNEAVINAPKPYTPDWTYTLAASLLYTGLITGFIFFQLFTYLGIRRCKYANRSRPNQSEGSNA